MLFLPLHSTPNLKMFPLHCIPQNLDAESLDKKLNIFGEKSFPPKTRVHPLQTDGRRTENRHIMCQKLTFPFQVT